ncbi:Elongation factor G mitochondrial [Bienertia sinuspersici]
MATSSQPSLLSYHSCCCSTSNSHSNSTTLFPSSLSLSTLHGPTKTHLPRNHSISLTRTYAKFDKFEGGDESLVQLQQQEIDEKEEEFSQQVKEEDDDCLPSDLEGAVRQSSQASASFVEAGGTRAIVDMLQYVEQVELLIPQLQFLDDEGAQAELWELSRVFLDTLIEETGCQKVKAIFPDTGAAALLKYQWKDANFGFSSLSDRKPVEAEDEIVVMVVPDYQIEDVGVGFNVRKLRRSFLRTFSVVYSMRPFAAGAVFRCYPGLWKVFYDDKDRPGRYLLAKELISRPDTEELESIFGDVQEKAEEGPSLFARAAGIFSSLNRFMRVITK